MALTGSRLPAGSDDPGNRGPLRKVGSWEASVSLLAPETEASALHALARIKFAQRANLVVVPLVQENLTVRAKILILRNPWAADLEKSHGCLLFHTPSMPRGRGLTHA
jgi:hypothetical protein